MSIKSVTIGENVRDCRTLESYIVIEKNDTAILVVSLLNRENPSEIKAILMRDIDYWIRDCDIDKIEGWEKDMRKGAYNA